MTGKEGKGKGKKENMMERLEYLNRLARGEASESSSSSDESSSDEEIDEEEDEEVVESRKLDDGDVPTGEETR